MNINPYISRFLDWDSAENVISLFQTKRAAKEITETVGMYEAWKFADEKFGVTPTDETAYVVVGDGSTPRTAAYFAYATRGDCHSIDPNLSPKKIEVWADKQRKVGLPVQRLSCYADYAKNVEIEVQVRRMVLLFPHSHCSIEEGLQCVKNSTYDSLFVISMPCCVPLDGLWSAKPHLCYTDHRVLSPKRDIHIWSEKKV